MKIDEAKRTKANHEIDEELKAHGLQWKANDVEELFAKELWEHTNSVASYKKEVVFAIYECMSDDTCWGSKKDCIEYAKDYQEWNNRKFDKKWCEEHIEKICGGYVLFGYSEAYLEED